MLFSEFTSRVGLDSAGTIEFEFSELLFGGKSERKNSTETLEIYLIRKVLIVRTNRAYARL